ncbi:IS21 family transposase [Nostocoides sp.]|uniref:IS21 family transposase n=1 Tax=Nostocoides sp. TaxID=1917966 RepID=UPI003BB093F4
MITVEDWALVRRLVADGVSRRQVARDLGLGRATVDRALASDRPPRYERPAVATAFTPFEPLVRQLLTVTPTMPATVLAERVGWEGSITWFRDNVRRVRPQLVPVDPCDRLTWLPGDAAQCDLWFPPKRIPLEDGTTALLPALVITCAHSRFMLAVMIPTRTTTDLLLGMWELLTQLGAVPRRLIWDNESGIGRGKRHAEGVGAFAGTLATTLQRLKAYDPESKGVVERRNGFFETSFMPGRDFTSPADFTAQFTTWLATANARVVRTTKAKPVDLLTRDKAAMLPLPPVAPAVGWVNRVRLGRDYYVRVDSCDYSVDPAVIGAFVDVTADLNRVQVHHQGRLVASHARVWARGMTVTDPAHVAAAKVLREQFQQPRPAPAPNDALVRDLAEYDHAFGLTDLVEDTTTDGEVA